MNPYAEEDEFVDMLKQHHHNYDNVILKAAKRHLILPYIEEYIESPEKSDFDAFRAELESFLQDLYE